MLLTDVTLIDAAPKGANLAEIQKAGKQKVMTSLGEQWQDVYASVYIAGMPFGNVLLNVPAPIDLLPGDVVRVEAGDKWPYEVRRLGKIIWTNTDLKAQEKAQAEARAADRKEHGSKR